MAISTMISAVLLVAVGVMGYVNGTPNPETGKVSPTAMIPAFFGIALGILGLLALKPNLRKHAMHVAAMLALLGIFGGLMPLFRQQSNTGAIDLTKPAAVSGLLMSFVCAGLLSLCIRSFIIARQLRKLTEPSE